MNIWRLMTYHENLDSENNRIAIGWDNISDLNLQQFQSPADISILIRQHYPE